VRQCVVVTTCVCVCVCVRERDVCVCVCVCVRERCVCVCERERERNACVCVCVHMKITRPRGLRKLARFQESRAVTGVAVVVQPAPLVALAIAPAAAATDETLVLDVELTGLISPAHRQAALQGAPLKAEAT
jgi:hypothetical protein